MTTSFGIIGGTGKQGTGLAKRLARLDYLVRIGSRSKSRGEDHATQLNNELSTTLITGGDNEYAANADIVVLAIPFDQVEVLVMPLEKELSGKIVIDLTVNLTFGKFIKTNLENGMSSYEFVREQLPNSKVITSLKTISFVKLNASHQLDESDFEITTSDEAFDVVSNLVMKFGLRPVRIRGKTHAHTIERMVALSIQLNKEYPGSHVGFQLCDLKS